MPFERHYDYVPQLAFDIPRCPKVLFEQIVRRCPHRADVTLEVALDLGQQIGVALVLRAATS